MLDARQLEALAAVLEQGGFGPAAQTLNVTLAAVSLRIRRFHTHAVIGHTLRSSSPSSTARKARARARFMRARCTPLHRVMMSASRACGVSSTRRRSTR